MSTLPIHLLDTLSCADKQTIARCLVSKLDLKAFIELLDKEVGDYNLIARVLIEFGYRCVFEVETENEISAVWVKQEETFEIKFSML